jgi:hypothetical protein
MYQIDTINKQQTAKAVGLTKLKTQISITYCALSDLMKISILSQVSVTTLTGQNILTPRIFIQMNF